MDKPKVIYIMGCGRSGTTILDIILGNHSGFLSVGELNNFRQAWFGKKFCSCGSLVTDCEIWKKIGDRFFDSDRQNGSIKMYDYQANYERQRVIWKQIFGFHKHNEIQQYHLYIFNIFKELQDLSSCTTIIDSSKSAGRALALLRNEKLDVKVLHVVRDPRGLYHSYQKRHVGTPVKSIWSSAIYWNTTNFLADMIKLNYRENRVIRIRYEDLVYKPNETIDKIEKFLNESLADVKEKIENEVPLGRAHLASGNRLRTQKSALKLKPDIEWKKKLKFYQRLLLPAACYPLMISYGYFKNDHLRSSN
jgi:hypothetical protein